MPVLLLLPYRCYFPFNARVFRPLVASHSLIFSGVAPGMPWAANEALFVVHGVW
jgi:hypothetical protein